MFKKKVSMLLAMTMVVGALGVTGCGSKATGEGAVTSEDATESEAENVFEVATVRWADWGEEYHLGFPDEAATEAGIEVKWNP